MTDEIWDAACVANSWRPIETAPKTGCFLAYWRSTRMRERTCPYNILEWDEDRTVLWTGGIAIHELEVSFSHWMPMPEPPDA